MKFGAVSDISTVDFSLPHDHSETTELLSKFAQRTSPLSYQVGFAKWDPKYLQGLYPKGVGTKQLEYYSNHINCIEMNAFLLPHIPLPKMFKNGINRSAEDFTFCPKLPQVITQYRRLKKLRRTNNQISYFHQPFWFKTRPVFYPDAPKVSTQPNLMTWHHLYHAWPKDVSLALELRHTDWYNDPSISKELYSLLETNNITNIITDTAGRRDLMHMRLTNDTAFIRFTGINDPTDYQRLDDWITRIQWVKMGCAVSFSFINMMVIKILSTHFVKGLMPLELKYLYIRLC